MNGLGGHPKVASGRHRPGFDPEEALEVVGEIGESDLGAGSGQTDSAHEQTEAVLLAGEHRLDGRANLGAGAVGLALRRRQVVAGLSSEVDLRAPALLGEMGFVGLRAVGRVGPDVARRVGRVEDIGQLRSVVGSRAGDGEAADEPVLAVDRDVRLIAEHRDVDAAALRRVLDALEGR